MNRSRMFAVLFASLILSALCLRAFLSAVDDLSGYPESLLEAKVWAFAAEKDSYDAIFLGSSHVFRQIDPEEFDRRVQGCLPGFRSYNFGAPGMDGVEEALIFTRVAATRPARLKFVFIDPRPVAPVRAVSLREPRFIGRHTPRLAFSVFLEILASRASLKARVQRAVMCWTGFLYNAFNYGGISRMHEIWTKRADTYSRGMGARGFVPLDLNLTQDVRRRRYFFANKGSRGYIEAVEEVKNLDAESGAARGKEDFARSFAARVIQGSEAAGFSTILVIPPRVEVSDFQLAASGAGYPAISFVDPKASPELFAPAHRWDEEHLNGDGARIYSRMLGDRFISEILRSRCEKSADGPAARSVF